MGPLAFYITMINITDPRTPQERDLDEWQAEWTETYRDLLATTRGAISQIQHLSYSTPYPTLYTKKDKTMNDTTFDFGIPAEFQEKLRNAMKDESGVKLPFAAPTMWWMNGKTALKNVKEINNANRFGGWGISKDEIDEVGTSWPDVPEHWQLHDLTNNEGNGYSAFLTRTAWVAPIARRYRWFDNKSHTNILCYLAIMTAERVLLPHGPVVLSAKSLTGVDLDKCFKEFATKTTQLRGKTLPAYFWHPIGTWEAEPVFVERKSKGGSGSSSVTPPRLFAPKDGITIETLKKWFVGVEVAEEMAKLLDLAQDWVSDWKNRKAEAKPEVLDEAQLDPFAPTDSDFPF
jgi:hypothetical protein